MVRSFQPTTEATTTTREGGSRSGSYPHYSQLRTDSKLILAWSVDRQGVQDENQQDSAMPRAGWRLEGGGSHPFFSEHNERAVRRLLNAG